MEEGGGGQLIYLPTRFDFALPPPSTAPTWFLNPWVRALYVETLFFINHGYVYNKDTYSVFSEIF